MGVIEASTPEGREAYRLLDWANADPQRRASQARDQVDSIARRLLDGNRPRALDEVRDVGTVLSRLAGAVTLANSGDAIELVGWQVITEWMARHHLARSSDGKFRRSPAALEKRITEIERQRTAAVKRLAPKSIPAVSPATRTILRGDRPAPSIAAQALGPEKPGEAMTPPIDHQMVMSHARNAIRQIEMARSNGELKGPDAERVSKSVTSLTKTALAADREIHRLEAENQRRDARIDALEQAIRDLAERQRVQAHNEAVKDQLLAVRQKHAEEIEAANNDAERKGGLITTIGASLANLGLTIGGFMALPGAVPATQHEWLLAVIPVSTAIAQAIAQPLYDAYREKRLKHKVSQLRARALREAQARMQAGEDIGLASDAAEAGAVRFLVMIFTASGLSSTQAAELAGDLIATR